MTDRDFEHYLTTESAWLARQRTIKLRELSEADRQRFVSGEKKRVEKRTTIPT